MIKKLGIGFIVLVMAFVGGVTVSYGFNEGWNTITPINLFNYLLNNDNEELNIANMTIAELELDLEEISSEKLLLQAEVDSLTGDILLMQSGIEQLEEDLADLTSEKLLLEQSITTLNTQILDLNDEILVLNSDIDDLQADEIVNAALILDLQAQVESNMLTINTLASEKANLELVVENLSSEKLTLQNTIANLNDDKLTLQSNLDALNAEITTLNTQMQELQVYISDLEPFVIADLEINGSYYKTYSLLEGNLNYNGVRYYDNIFSELIIDINQLDENNYNVNYAYIIFVNENDEMVFSYNLEVDSTSVDFTGLYDSVVMGIVDNSPTFNFNKTINYLSWMQLYEDLSNNLTNSYLTLETTLSNGVFVSLINNVSISYNLISQSQVLITSGANPLYEAQVLTDDVSFDIYLNFDTTSEMLTSQSQFKVNENTVEMFSHQYDYEGDLNYSNIANAYNDFHSNTLVNEYVGGVDIVVNGESQNVGLISDFYNYFWVFMQGWESHYTPGTYEQAQGIIVNDFQLIINFIITIV